jgi:hypothetical protein
MGNFIWSSPQRSSGDCCLLARQGEVSEEDFRRAVAKCTPKKAAELADNDIIYGVCCKSGQCTAYVHPVSRELTFKPVKGNIAGVTSAESELIKHLLVNTLSAHSLCRNVVIMLGHLFPHAREGEIERVCGEILALSVPFPGSGKRGAWITEYVKKHAASRSGGSQCACGGNGEGTNVCSCPCAAGEKCSCNCPEGCPCNCPCGKNRKCSCVGGVEITINDLSKYAESPVSASNVKFVEAVLDVGRKMGMNITGDTPKAMVQSFLKQIPSISGTPANCKRLGEAVNAAVGEKVIDTDMNSGAICQQVNNIMASWGGAMTGELIGAYADLCKVLSNTAFVINVLEKIVEALKKDLAPVKEIEVRIATAEKIDLIESFIKQLRNLNKDVQGLVNAHVNPALTSLKSLASSVTGIGQIAKMGDFSNDQLAKYAQNALRLKGMHAAQAVLIENALKAIGLTMKEYIATVNAKRLSEITNKVVEKNKGLNLTPEQLDATLEAIKTLETFASKITSGELTEYLEQHPKEGGAADAPQYASRTEDKRVENERKFKKMIFVAFYRRLNEQLDDFEKQLDELAKKVGHEIPVDDCLNDLSAAIKKINYDVIRKKDSYLAITGYHNDAHSKAIRDSLLMDFNYFIKEIELCMSKPTLSSANKYFVGARDAAKALVETIEVYTRDIAARSGETYSGGAGEGADSMRGIDTKVSYKSPYEKDKTIRRFEYNIKLAALKENLKRQGQDVAFYAEKYDDFVAKSIAKYLRDEQEAGEKEEKLIKEYFSADEKLRSNTAEVIDAATKAKTPGGEDLTADEICKDILSFLKEQRSVKQNFWATVEAIDKYMQLFAAGMMNNPDDIGDIGKMLDNVQALRIFYTEETATKIADVFREFNSGVTGMAEPFVAPRGIDKITKSLKEALSSFGTLKNLLSIFSRIASKFGNKDIGSQIFMSPGRMYTNLINFMIYASLGQPPQSTDLGPIHKFSVVLRHIGSSRTETHVPRQHIGAHDIFGDGGRDHEMFVMVIKSICAKILTVLGLHEVFERPLNVPSYYKINNIRMIVGGANIIPQINENAIELYMRLPLLCQFYKNIFGYNEEPIKTPTPPAKSDLHINDRQAAKISFVPDIDGVFSGLIRLIFRKLDFDDPAAYSNEDIMEIIRECNSIYQKLEKKHSTNTVNCIINDLVSEINRRYGIITEKSRELYEKEHGFRYDYDVAGVTDPYAKDDPRSIKLLDGEDEENPPMSAAQRLIASAPVPVDSLKQPGIGLSQTHITMINQFRAKIDSMLVQPTTEGFNFREIIKSTKSRVALEPSNEKKFELVCQMMRSSHMLTDGDSTKFMMVHEMIIAGLNTLSGVHSILRRYIDICDVLSPENVKTFIPAYRGRPAAGKKIAIPANLASGYKAFRKRMRRTSAGYLADSLFRSSEPVDQWKPDNGSDDYTDRFSSLVAGPAGNYDDNSRGVENAFRLILTTIFEISNSFGGLVQVSFTKDKLHMNFGGLRDKITAMLESVSYFINQARAFLPEDDLKRFTDKRTPGSLYWFREQLYEKMIVGREPAMAAGKKPYTTLDKTPLILTQIIKKLSSCNWAGNAFTEEIFFAQRKIHFDGPVRVPFTTAIGSLHLVGNPIGKRYIDARYTWDYGFCKIDDKDYTETRSLLFSFNQTIAKFIHTFFDSAVGKIYVGLLDKFCNGLFAGDIRDIGKTFPDMHPGDYRKKNAVGARTGPALNTIPWDKYLSDEVSLGLETESVNSVIPAYRYPFVAPPAGAIPTLVNTSIKYPSEGNQILFMSLAHILNNLYSTKNSTLQVTYTYLIDNVADIPHSVREKMRANLPVFRELFDSIAKKCALIREIFDAFQPAVVIDDTTYSTLYEFSEYRGIGNKEIGEQTRNAILPSLRKIESGCSIFIEICDTVLKEIGDTATYFETHQGSIKEFIAKYNTAPFNPLSMILSTYRNANPVINTDFLPFFEMGDIRFKFAYGTRKLLHSQDIKLDHLPFMSQLLQRYNNLATPVTIVDAKKYEEQCLNMVALVRYVYNMRHISVILRSSYSGGQISVGNTAVGDIHSKSLVGMPFISDKAFDRKKNKFAWRIDAIPVAHGNPHDGDKWFATNKSDFSLYKYGVDEKIRDGPKFVEYMTLPLGAVVEQIEDPNVDKRIFETAERVIGTHIGQSPEQLWTMNIIDLGIIPISIHAMQRFIPLANIINYAYSFDRLICELVYGYGFSKTQEIIGLIDSDQFGVSKGVHSALDALLMSVLRPFRKTEYGEELYYENMMRGASTVEGLDRGKFLYELLKNVIQQGTALRGHEGNPIPRDIHGQGETWKGIGHHEGSYLGREIMGGKTTMSKMTDINYSQRFGVDGVEIIRHTLGAPLPTPGSPSPPALVLPPPSGSPPAPGSPPPPAPALSQAVSITLNTLSEGMYNVVISNPNNPLVVKKYLADLMFSNFPDVNTISNDTVKLWKTAEASSFAMACITKYNIIQWIRLAAYASVNDPDLQAEYGVFKVSDQIDLGEYEDNFEGINGLLQSITNIDPRLANWGIIFNNDPLFGGAAITLVTKLPDTSELAFMNGVGEIVVKGGANKEISKEQRKIFTTYIVNFILDNPDVKFANIVEYATHVTANILNRKRVETDVITYITRWTVWYAVKNSSDNLNSTTATKDANADQQLFDNLINYMQVPRYSAVNEASYSKLQDHINVLVTTAFDGKKAKYIKTIDDEGHFINSQRHDFESNYDTYLCRELVFVQNSYRLVQLAIRRGMAQSDENIIEGSIVASEPQTEFFNRASSKGTLLYDGRDGSYKLNKNLAKK